MGTARVKQEEETDTRIIARVVRNLEERSVGTKGKRPKEGLTSAADLTIELLEGLLLTLQQPLLGALRY